MKAHTKDIVFRDLEINLDGADEGKIELLGLLRVIAPQPECLPNNFRYFHPDDVKYFDALFQRFGLRLRSSDERFEDIKYVAEIWYRLVGHFGAFIECADLWPKIFERRLAEWPPAFAAYLRAVMDNDLPTAQALAAELNIEKLGIVMPRELMG